MKRNISVHLKATFLLIVFSLNMIIGFACPALDTWFNTSPNEETEIIAHEGFQHQYEAVRHHKSKVGKGNCCNDHVIKFSEFDKPFPQCFASLYAIFFITLITPIYNIILYTSKASANIKYFVLVYHPQIPDIRITIQSFQI